MDKLAKLMQDIAILWDKYHPMYLRGMLSTLGLALAATAIGCIIGLACGILNTIPCAKNDPWPKRILLKILRVIIRIYVEVFRGTPMMLQAVFIFYALPYFTDNALRFDNIWAASILIVSIDVYKRQGVSYEDIDVLFAGDLLNQCISSSFAARGTSIPFLGLYGACSTMAESLLLAAAFVDAGFARTAAALTSSHFASAERQYRFPLGYGGQRTPTAQWTVTGSGCCIVGGSGSGVRIEAATIGRVQDLGIKDANNMGAAMAPAAIEMCIRDRKRDCRAFASMIFGTRSQHTRSPAAWTRKRWRGFWGTRTPASRSTPTRTSRRICAKPRAASSAASWTVSYTHLPDGRRFPICRTPFFYGFSLTTTTREIQ